MSIELTHWGTHVAAALRARQIDTLFTLTGGHLFPLYDGAVQAGIRLIDVRHEATAAFAAEAWGRLQRRAGAAAVTAGPGVFNTVSAVATAQKNGSALILLGGRAPQSRWGRGSLQEVDHVPVLAPLCKRAETAKADALGRLSSLIREAMSPPRGPAFMDFPIDLDARGTLEEADTQPPSRREPDPEAVRKILSAVSRAKRPALIAGSNVYADGAWQALAAFAEAAEIPVFMNGMGRGALPADHRLAFSRTRGRAMREADVVLVAGTPLDFRLAFGDAFADDAAVFHLDSAPELLSTGHPLEAGLGADLELTFRMLADGASPAPAGDWIESLRQGDRRLADEAQAELTSDQVPIHPLRVYGELKKVLARDAIVICDGGDFVSYAGREVPSYVPGGWLDPGPFGCLGCGPGYALAAKLLFPNRQVVLLLGDGACGFSEMEFDTLVRHRLPILAIVGNNGVWGLEKHPMRALFGYDVAADLRQETGYERIAVALGGHGERVDRPDQVRPALERALASGVPALVNVLIDPAIAYPRTANLA